MFFKAFIIFLNTPSNKNRTICFMYFKSRQCLYVCAVVLCTWHNRLSLRFRSKITHPEKPQPLLGVIKVQTHPHTPLHQNSTLSVFPLCWKTPPGSIWNDSEMERCRKWCRWRLANHDRRHVSVTKDHRGQYAHTGHISSPLRLLLLTVTHFFDLASNSRLDWQRFFHSAQIRKTHFYSFTSCFI